MPHPLAQSTPSQPGIARHELHSEEAASQPSGHQRRCAGTDEGVQNDAQWHDSLGDATVADAILDRLVHNAHRLELRGDSLRRPREHGARTVDLAAVAPNGSDQPTAGGRAGKRAATTAQDDRE